jgi:hypothetical protein
MIFGVEGAVTVRSNFSGFLTVPQSPLTHRHSLITHISPHHIILLSPTCALTHSAAQVSLVNSIVLDNEDDVFQCSMADSVSTSTE